MSYHPPKEVYTLRTEAMRERLLGLLRAMPLADARGLPLKVTFEREASPRLVKMRNKFHAWVRLIANHTGTPFPIMKRQLKEHILGTEEIVNAITGEIEEEPLHVGHLDDEALGNLLTQTKVLAADHWELQLPDSPEEWERP